MVENADKAKESDKGKEADKAEDYEKRYKDSQSHITTLEQENAVMREAAAKDKELLDKISPYVNWDAASGMQTATEAVEDDGYVDKKTLNKTIKDLRDQIWRNQQTQNFRLKYPDMVPYEDLVAVFLNKTDTRHPFEERVESAVKNAKKLIESERAKGAELSAKEKREKEAKEAEAAGLAEAKGSEGKDKEPEGETFEDYIKNRKAQSRKAQGLTV